MTRPPPRTSPSQRAVLRVGLASTFVAMAVLVSMSASAQQTSDLSDVFGNIGSADVGGGEQDELARDLASNEGTLVGQVIDAESGLPVAGVTVILVWLESAEGTEPRQEVQVTNAAGEYRFPRVPEGSYGLSFVRSGYRLSEMKDFGVTAGQVNTADFPLPPKETESAGDVLNLEAFVVEASMVGEMMNEIELRMDADALVDVMGTEDLSKYAASDVADALKRVSGVNVVEGRFAVIRGLEDRYSSTLFNRAPIPSADPLRQSVQLDLFPSDIVSGIVVAKTFEAPTPGNSGAGSIDIGTMGYPDEPTIKLSAGTGFNENAADRFLEYRESSPIARFGGGSSVIESDLNVSLGGRKDFWDRDFRAKAVFAREIDYDTAIGVQEGLEPRLPDVSRSRVLRSGGLALKELTVSDGRFDWARSRRTEQYTYFGALGMDIDRDGDHRVDFTAFHTEKKLKDVERRDNGYIPGFDYANTPPDQFRQQSLYGITRPRSAATIDSMLNTFRQDFEKPWTGPLSFDPIVRGQSIVQDRRLTVYQVNGEHDLARLLEGLDFKWVANYARTRQDETAFRLRYWYEPYTVDEFNLQIPPFPPRVSNFADQGPGSFRTSTNDILFFDNEIDEKQYFARGDFLYEFEPARWVAGEAGTGFWYESSKRTLTFNEYLGTDLDPNGPGVVGGQFVEGPSEAELGPNVFYSYGLNGLGVPAVSTFEREIAAGYLDLKLTFWDDLDVIGGVRLEKIDILSNNRPFTGECLAPGGAPSAQDPTRTGSCPTGYLPRIVPTRYLYLDRTDNPANPFFREDPRFARTGVYPDQVLGIDLPKDANGLVDLLTAADVFDRLTGEIDELEVFPMASVAYRPIEGLTLRGAYSETAARPSFRELAYYASIVPDISDRIMGNPFLVLSDVQSFDTRVEYFWGDVGDLFAVSFFYKTIQRPIELVVLRDFTVANAPIFEGPFRVYRNNENEAKLKGIELESRVTLSTLGDIGNQGRLGHWRDWSSFLEWFSIGGNFSYIDARVARSLYEINLASKYFVSSPQDLASGRIQALALPGERRLYNQPEWTANADFTFDQPDWGTKLTLSVFAISDVLNAAGAANLAASGDPEGYVLDEFVESFYQLDMVVSQSFGIPHTPGEWTARVSVKNLTDTERGIIYDREVTNLTYHKRTFTIGRDYTFSLQYQLTF